MYMQQFDISCYIIYISDIQICQSCFDLSITIKSDYGIIILLKSMQIGVAKTLAIWLISSNSSGVSNFRGIADISEQVIAFSIKITITNMRKKITQTTTISGATILYIN